MIVIAAGGQWIKLLEDIEACAVEGDCTIVISHPSIVTKVG